MYVYCRLESEKWLAQFHSTIGPCTAWKARVVGGNEVSGQADKEKHRVAWNVDKKNMQVRRSEGSTCVIVDRGTVKASRSQLSGN